MNKRKNNGPKSKNGLNRKPSTQNTTPRRSPMGLWLVMDGRARFDLQRASILEALNEGPRDQIPRKAAKKMWADHDACLVFAPVIGKDKQGRGILGKMEFVEEIK